MTDDADPGTRPRVTARQLVDLVRARRPDLLVHEGIDLGSAIEQVFFGRLRRPRRGERLSGLRSIARAVYHGVAALRPGERPRAGDVVALVVNPAQAKILEPVRIALDERGVPTFTVYESHARGVGRATRRSCRLVDRLTPRRAARLLAFELRARLGLKEATASFGTVVDPSTADRMRSALGEAIGRAALYATCIDDLACSEPSILVGFNEIGRWSRILPAVGRRAGIPTLDVAHAEAADADAIEGAAYDRYAVFGQHAKRVLEHAGIESSAIVPVGAPRFDGLIARHRPTEPPVERRIVFASQWITGAMTEEVKVRTVRAALAAAAAAAPCELVLQRHPIERDDLAATLAASEPVAGVTVRVGEPHGLHAALDGAWLLVTGWSNAVFEAVLSNVPALCVNATGGPAPMAFVEDGIALGASDAAGAARAARALLTPEAWVEAVRQARDRLADHLGPLDGRATERLVELILAMRSPVGAPPPRPGND